MNLGFLPPLQQTAAVRIALCIYHDKEIEEELEKIKDISFGKGYFHRNLFEFWKVIEKKVADKLPSLPDLLKMRVSRLIRPIHGTTHEWLYDHDFFVKVDDSFDYKSNFCRKSDGTIDKTETAKKLVQAKNFNPEARFAMACTYFLEDEVLALWHGDENLNLKDFTSKHGSSAALRFWTKRLKNRSLRKIPWKASIDGEFKNLRVCQHDNRLRISCFFPYLSGEGKKNYLNHLRWFKGHRDDLRLCLRKMNEEEFADAVSVYPVNVLINYLFFPLQYLFVDMAKELWSHMNFDHFKEMLHHIIFNKILHGSEDFDYVGLFKEFWDQSPASYRRKIKKDQFIFKLTEATLNYDEKNPSLSLPETIAELLGEGVPNVSTFLNV